MIKIFLVLTFLYFNQLANTAVIRDDLNDDVMTINEILKNKKFDGVKNANRENNSPSNISNLNLVADVLNSSSTTSNIDKVKNALVIDNLENEVLKEPNSNNKTIFIVLGVFAVFFIFFLAAVSEPDCCANADCLTSQECCLFVCLAEPHCCIGCCQLCNG